MPWPMQLIKGSIQLEPHFVSEGQYVISLTGSMAAGRHGAKAVAKSYILICKQWAEKLRLVLPIGFEKLKAYPQ